jgi:alcohol dehydrogenase
MRAVVYHGPGNKTWEEVPKPSLRDDTDAVVRVDAVTICGTTCTSSRVTCRR